MDYSYSIVLNKNCRCGLADCPVYKDTPTSAKASEEDVFYVFRTISDERRQFAPKFAILSPRGSKYTPEQIADGIKGMLIKCEACNAVNKDKRPQGKRIEINLRSLSEDALKYVYENCGLDPQR